MQITRIEGQGNGGNILDILPESEKEILANNFVQELKYKTGRGPINVSVVDPLNVIDARYILKFNKNVSQSNLIKGNCDWEVEVYSPDWSTLIGKFNSQKAISNRNEQLFWI